MCISAANELERYKRFFKSAHDLFFILDRKGRFTEVNPKFAELLGYTSEELIGHTSRRIIHPEDLDKIRDFFRDVLKGGVHKTEFRAITKDGKTLWFDLIEWSIGEEIEGIVREITDKKRLEDELRKSEQRYRDLWENTNDMFFILDSRGNIIDANAKAMEVFGYSSDEFERIELRDVVDERYLDKARDMQKLLISGKEVEAQEFLCRKRDGSRIWVEVRGRAIKEGNEVVAIQGIARDVTQRKMLEDKLRESEEMFRSLAEKSLVRIYLIQDGVFKYVNPKFAELMGYTVNELIGKSPLDFVHPEDKEPVYISRRIKGKINPVNYPLRIVRKDGVVRVCEVFGSRTFYKGKPAVVGTLIDNTERIEMERDTQIE